MKLRVFLLFEKRFRWGTLAVPLYQKAVSPCQASQGSILLNSNSVYPEFSRRFYGSQSFTGVLPTVTVTYTPTIQDGTYFIRNFEASKYLSIPNDTESEEVITESFDVDYTKWIVTLQSNGYYTIKSAFSNLYLGIDTNDITGTSIVRQKSTTGRGSQWAILPMSNGNYALMANPVVSNSGGEITNVLSLMPGNESSGVVGQYAYANDSEYQDEWQLFYCKYDYTTYEYTIDHYYDIGYNIRFSDSESTALEKLKSYHNMVAEQFAVRFGIELFYSFTLYTSCADLCKISQHGVLRFENLDDSCTHLLDDLSRDKLRTDVRQYIENNGLPQESETRSLFIWTGHIMTGNVVSSSTDYAVVITPSQMTTKDENAEENRQDIVYNNKSAQEVFKQSVYSMMHEASHQLGASDHYRCGAQNESEKPCSPLCDECNGGKYQGEIMNSRFESIDDIYRDNLYCNYCIESIREHLKEHHEGGEHEHET